MERVFPYIQSEPSLFQFMNTASCLLPTHLSTEPDSIFSVMSSKKKECCCLIPLKLPVSQAKQTYLSQPLLTGWVFQLPDPLGSPSPTSLLFINVFPVLRVPKLGTALWMRSNEQQVERNNHFLLSADYVPSHRVQDVVASLFFRLRESGLWRARGKGRGKGEKAPVKP